MNNKFLLKIWIPTIILIIVISSLFIKSFYNDGNFSIFIGLVLSATIFIIFKYFTSNKINNSLKEDSPKKLIEILTNPLKKNNIVKGNFQESFISYNTALSYVLYGQYELGSKEINKINWEEKEPLFQALNHNIQSLNHYFNTKDYKEGLRLARKAKGLVSVYSRYPGQKQSENTYQAYVDIGLILTGQINSDEIRNLENIFRTAEFIPKLIIAWGLAVFYKNNKELDKANEMIKFCQENAPYCIPLHETDVNII